MSDVRAIDFKAIGARVRACREGLGISSLETLADQIKLKGCERPSTAKLSRIETGLQPVTTDILSALSAVTGIPATELRPDLAALMAPKHSTLSSDTAQA